VGLELVLLALPRLLPLGILTDFVTARAPVPPTMAGLPLPSLICVSFALRVRAAGAGDGAGVGSVSDGAGSSFSVSFAVSGSGATVISSSSSSSEWCIMTEPLDGPRDLPLVRRLGVLVAAERVRELGVAAVLGGEDLWINKISYRSEIMRMKAYFTTLSSRSMRASVLRLARTPKSWTLLEHVPSSTTMGTNLAQCLNISALHALENLSVWDPGHVKGHEGKTID